MLEPHGPEILIHSPTTKKMGRLRQHYQEYFLFSFELHLFICLGGGHVSWEGQLTGVRGVLVGEVSSLLPLLVMGIKLQSSGLKETPLRTHWAISRGLVWVLENTSEVRFEVETTELTGLPSPTSSHLIDMPPPPSWLWGRAWHMAKMAGKLGLSLCKVQGIQDT